MIGLIERCAQSECDNEFIKATHNQKYCSTECCKIQTNRNIMKKYHERTAIKRGKKRACLDCGNMLSRYNDSDICGSCTTRRRNDNQGEAAALVGSVSWL